MIRFYKLHTAVHEVLNLQISRKNIALYNCTSQWTQKKHYWVCRVANVTVQFNITSLQMEKTRLPIYGMTQKISYFSGV